MEIADIKKNIEKILDNNKAQNITSINLKNKTFYSLDARIKYAKKISKPQKKLK